MLQVDKEVQHVRIFECWKGLLPTSSALGVNALGKAWEGLHADLWLERPLHLSPSLQMWQDHKARQP